MVTGDLDRVEDQDLHRRQDTSEVAADAPQPGLVEQALDTIRGDAHGDVDERGLADAQAGELARDAPERRGFSASIAAAREDSVAVGGDQAIADEIALTTRLVAERHDLRRPLRADQAPDLHLHLLHRGAQRLIDEPRQGRVAGEAVPDAVFHRRQRRLGVLEPCDGVCQVLCEGLHRQDPVGTSASRGRRRRQYPLEQTAKRQMRLACLDVGGREVVGRERRLDPRDHRPADALGARARLRRAAPLGESLDVAVPLFGAAPADVDGGVATTAGDERPGKAGLGLPPGGGARLGTRRGGRVPRGREDAEGEADGDEGEGEPSDAWSHGGSSFRGRRSSWPSFSHLRPAGGTGCVNSPWREDAVVRTLTRQAIRQ